MINLYIYNLEAFTNALKHANATEVVLRSKQVLRNDLQWAVITLSDNGRCPATATQGMGHGLGNMQLRAHKLNGELTVKLTPTGSSVELMLPA